MHAARTDFEIQIKNFDELSDHDLRLWGQYRSATQWLDSPFFSPEFVRTVACLDDKLQVAVVRANQVIVGFLPFESRGRAGKSVASVVTEMNGLIGSTDYPFVPSNLLSPMGLNRFYFDCIPLNQVAFSPYVIRETDSHYISLHEGIEGYRQFLQTKRSRQSQENDRKLRKLEREHGAVTWNRDCSDLNLLELLTRWKREQYQRTGMQDVLGVPSVQKLLRSLLKMKTPSFGGLLSCLSVNGRPIALHFGLRDNKVLASWFPAYDPAFAGYSPGRIAMLKLIEEAAVHGIERIDLGQGDERYKLSLSNGNFRVGEGVVCRGRIGRIPVKTWIRAREFASTSAYLKVPLQCFRFFRNLHMGVSSQNLSVDDENRNRQR